jgi:hypothetical protein
MTRHPSPTTDRPTASTPAWPPELAGLLARVGQLLREGKPEAALALTAGDNAPWVRNARGVCLLRLGRAGQAVEALRDLVFAPAGFGVREDAHPVFQANYAAALLLDGNRDGFWAIFSRIRDRGHPAVARLDDAVHRWKAGLTAWQRLGSLLGGGPRFTLDFPPGEL